MAVRALVACAAVAVVMTACDAEGESSAPAPPSPRAPAAPSPSPRPFRPPSTASVRSQPGLPPAVADERAGIIVAARREDPEFLRFLLKPRVFLSDYGFGKDPVDRWLAAKDEPLEIMGTLLKMPYTKERTNEGLLFRWPAYTAESTRSDMTSEDRRLFLKVMSRREVRNLFWPEFGYVGPRLGILRDGTWWYFVSAGNP
jgi:hypothetical protein